MSEFDLGHDYKDAVPISDVLLWTFGALDELAAMDILEIAGDSPLPDHETRKRYRELKKSGYTPTLEEVLEVLKAHVAELLTTDVVYLFNAIITNGWSRIHEAHHQAKAEEIDDGPKPSDYGLPDGWCLL